MARLDTRSIPESMLEQWFASEQLADADVPDLSGETPEIREWRMIVAFLQNC